MDDLKELLFNIRQAVNDGHITKAEAAYVRAQVEHECAAWEVVKEMEQRA
jgi:hypothetical protein